MLSWTSVEGFSQDDVSFCLYLFSAPDENPTGVQGYGTHHNNLVISWKVIKFYESICFNPDTFTVAQRAL